MIDTALVTGLKNLDQDTVTRFWNSVKEQKECGEVVVVDYGSTSENLVWERALFCGNGVKFIEVARDTDIWREGRCYNIGIRASSSQYVVTVTADVILSDNFILECDAALKSKPNVMVLCLRTNAENGVEVGYAPQCYFGNCIGASREWLEKAHGFDEIYHGWGRHDMDLVYRGLVHGLEWVWIEDRVKILHPWHPGRTLDHTGNEDYYYAQESTRTLTRNPNGWGEL